MLRPSFVPPGRDPRSCATTPGLRVDLVEDRTRYKQRVEKLLEDALIKLSTVASDIFGKSGRAMLGALIAGERDPDVLAELALGKMRSKRPRPQRGAHRPLRRAPRRARCRCCSTRSTPSTRKIEALTARVDRARSPPCPPASAPPAGPGTADRPPPPSARWRASTRSPASGPPPPRPSSLRSASTWPSSRPPGTSSPGPSSRRAPIQSGPRSRSGQDRQGQPLPRSGSSPRQRPSLARTDTFLGERYRRLVKRRGKLKAHRGGLPLDPRHRLAPSRRPRRPAFTISGRTFTPATVHTQPPDPQPRPPARGSRPPRHPQPGRLTTPSGLRPERGSAPHPGRRAHGCAVLQRDFRISATPFGYVRAGSNPRPAGEFEAHYTCPTSERHLLAAGHDHSAGRGRPRLDIGPVPGRLAVHVPAGGGEGDVAGLPLAHRYRASRLGGRQCPPPPPGRVSRALLRFGRFGRLDFEARDGPKREARFGHGLVDGLAGQ